MKKTVFPFIVLLLFVFVSCEEKTCEEEDVHIGTYDLNSESKANWYPYSSVDSLIFKNGSGDTLTLFLSEQASDLQDRMFKYTCLGGWGEYAKEFYTGESMSSSYEAKRNGTIYNFRVKLSIDFERHGGEPEELVLFDLLEKHFVVLVEGSHFVHELQTNFIASNRGNNLNMDAIPLSFENVKFHDQVNINDVTHYSVWAILNWENVEILYFKEKLGILAFQGENNEMWSRKE